MDKAIKEEREKAATKKPITIDELPAPLDDLEYKTDQRKAYLDLKTEVSDPFFSPKEDLKLAKKKPPGILKKPIKPKKEPMSLSLGREEKKVAENRMKKQ